MQTSAPSTDLHATIAEAANDAIVRTVGIVALCGIALIHILDLPGKFTDTPYMGVMYVGAIVGSLALAAMLTRTSDRRVWTAAGALATAIIVCFVLSRSTGLPQATDDIGNWSEPLGLASLFVEGSLACLSAGVLAMRHERAVGRGARVARRQSVEVADS